MWQMTVEEMIAYDEIPDFLLDEYLKISKNKKEENILKEIASNITIEDIKNEIKKFI
jgi:hypothetical protein